ncbi:phage holin family protein [Streptomyces longispororuber]|uniref:phage holin family protein n=1 Tax=Streptomyces longispororuber TaxID=68230 RepID=UPI0037022EB5
MTASDKPTGMTDTGLVAPETALSTALSQVVHEAVRASLRESLRTELRDELSAQLADVARKQRRRASLYAAAGVTALYAGAAAALTLGLVLALGLPGWAAALIVTALLAVAAVLLRNAARPTRPGAQAHTSRPEVAAPAAPGTGHAPAAPGTGSAPAAPGTGSTASAPGTDDFPAVPPKPPVTPDVPSQRTR